MTAGLLLGVDVGNTHTALGVLDGSDLVGHWRISTVRERTADEYHWLVSGFLGADRLRPQAAAIASVVPEATTALRLALERIVGDDVLVVGPGMRTGMPLKIDNPREVGADRIVNSIAAATRHGVPVLVIDFGTATTIDVVGRDGDYLGGAIAPGVEVSMDALVDATAALRRVDLEPPRTVVGRSTVEALRSGLMYGHAGLVDGLARRMMAELGDGERVVRVATGGLAATIVPLCSTVDTVDEHLTLHGLRLLYDRNRP